MSTAIAKNFQVGADSTAANNFTIRQPATPDGTVRIANGNSGTTTDLVTVTSAGKVGIGTTAPQMPFELAYTTGTPSAALLTTDAAMITAQDTAPGLTLLVASSASATHRGVIKGTRARGTLSSPTAPSSGDNTFSLLGSIYDGSTTLATAGITFEVDGTVAVGDAPQAISFLTGATSRIERLRISNAGQTTFTGNAVINANSTSAALRITQTGTGNALLVEDSASTDATPFVIDQNGVVVSGNTAPISAFLGPRIQAQVTDATASFSSIRFSADPGPVRTVYAKSRGALGVNTAVLNGDEIGSLDFAAADGTSYVAAARIFAAVDGTPGTNDMPGRLIFSTTADGASTPTEWMRIGSTGAIGFNSTITIGGASGRFRFAGNITGAVSCIGVLYTPTIQSDVTTTAAIFNTLPSTQDAAFTLANLQHYVAAQGTITGGSRTAPTNQVGFQVNSTLTGATNNFGFRSDIAAATGRWNFYAAGTAANYFAGQVQLADGSAAAPALSNFGDENTGIYFPAADTIAFVEGGTEVVRITDAGNVGFGTTTPRNTAGYTSLGINNTTGGLIDFFTAGTTVATLIADTGLVAFGSVTSLPLIFTTTNVERMRIDSSGNVGIGTTSPTNLLDVNADSIRVRTARTPASATATGNAGEICWDASYIYICTATNTWKRVAIATWP